MMTSCYIFEICLFALIISVDKNVLTVRGEKLKIKKNSRTETHKKNWTEIEKSLTGDKKP